MGFIITYLDPLEQFNLIILYINSITTLLHISNFNIMLIAILSFLAIIFNYIINLPLKSWVLLILKNLTNFLFSITKNNLNISVHIFLPFLGFIFLLILCSNLIGMIPYTFTLTSHLSITFFIALSFFIGINLFGILNHGLEYLNLFLPSSSPILISPLLIVVEVVSYFARVFSLSIRLFANMMAGHALMKILSSFSYLFFQPLTPGLIIVGFIVALIILIVIGLEFLIAFLQAYVFFILMVVYLNDLVQLGH